MLYNNNKEDVLTELHTHTHTHVCVCVFVKYGVFMSLFAVLSTWLNCWFFPVTFLCAFHSSVVLKPEFSVGETVI
jgi:uncharacterized membrane protein YjjP (DUF1212 family)